MKVAGPVGKGGLVDLNADATIYSGLFNASEHAEMGIAFGRKVYVHLVRGDISINGTALSAGDALLISEETRLHLKEGRNAEVLVFDLSPT